MYKYLITGCHRMILLNLQKLKNHHVLNFVIKIKSVLKCGGKPLNGYFLVPPF